MGAYLSSPVTDKRSEDRTSEKFDYGASAMQGWRYYMEDAHNCIPHLDDETAMFGVYDGHGGAEVAMHCAQHLPDFIKNSKAYKEGKLGKGLQDAFMEFDATLTQEDVIRELRQLAGTMQEADGDDEEAAALTEEATVPLTELLAKYGYQLKEHANTKSLRKKVNQEDLLSPVIRKSQSRVNPLSEALAGEKDNILKAEDANSEESTNKQTDAEESNDKQTKSDNDLSEVVDSGVAKQCNGKTAHSGTGGGDASDCHISTEAVTDNKEEVVAGQSGVGNGGIEAEEEDQDDDDDDDEEYKEDEEEDDDDGEDDDEDDEDEDDDEDDDDDDSDDDEGECCEGEGECCDDAGAMKGMMGLSDKEEPGSDSGCTAVVALMRDNQLIVANAGDSRCIVSRSGKAIDMSLDHKPEDEPERLRIETAGGKVTSDGRVNGGLNLSRAIGDHCYKQNKDLPAEQQMITAFPDIQTLNLTPQDDFIVIACDGIWNVLSSQETVDFVKERIDKEDMKLSMICEEMFDHCLAPDSLGDGTGCDNMTCIIVRLNHKSQDSSQSETSGKRPASQDDVHSSASPAKRAKN
ncbi:protein phosphatase 1G-like isoform X2 [Ptychodera flava]|uniref:protein phosphatase 1G-like isoform X2 n=1 Tax=Ptychodera flava TaxID=63121 RepID=UPI003969FB2B